MNDLKIGYLAGLIDGEGCISLTATGQEIQVNSVDFDILERAYEFSEYKGNLSGPYDNGYQPIYRWRVGNRVEVETLLIRIYPLMCKRRQIAIDKVLEYISIRRQTIKICPQCFIDFELGDKPRNTIYCSAKCRRQNGKEKMKNNKKLLGAR